MKIRYPVSAILTALIGSLFLGLSVLWSFGHMIAVIAAVVLLYVQRGVCHWEAKSPLFAIHKSVE